METVITNQIHFLQAIITAFGSRVSGLVVGYKVIRSLDEITVLSGYMTDMGNGIYKTGVVLAQAGQYRVEYTTPVGYEDDIDSLIVIDPDLPEQTEIPESTAKFDAELIYQGGQTAIYRLLHNSPTGYISTHIRIAGMSDVTLTVRTTGRMDIQVSNDDEMWITYRNVYNVFAGHIGGFGYVRCIALEGYSSAVLQISV